MQHTLNTLAATWIWLSTPNTGAAEAPSPYELLMHSTARQVQPQDSTLSPVRHKSVGVADASTPTRIATKL